MIHFGFDFTVNASEVAPGQHEMSPVFRAANVSCDGQCGCCHPQWGSGGYTTYELYIFEDEWNNKTI